MIRLHLTVEGQTEAAFVTEVLKPHLAQFDVFLNSPRLTGTVRRKRGQIPRGGMSKFADALSDIQRWLKEDQRPDARFSMMVDFYGLPHDFPGYDSAISRHGFREQVKTLKEALKAEINDSRFLPYLQVHEFEALVLTEPLRLSQLYSGKQAELRQLAAECARYSSPEEINGGPYSHPKYRIQQVFSDYDENIAGPLLAHDIGLSTLRQKCPHFGEWLTQLERLDVQSST